MTDFGLGKDFSSMGIIPNAGIQISTVPIRLENIICTTITGTGSNRHLCFFDSAVPIAAATPIVFCLRLASTSNPTTNYKWDFNAPFMFSAGLYIVISTVESTVTLVGATSVQYMIRYRNITI